MYGSSECRLTRAEIEADCCESIIKILLMWQPRHFIDHNNNAANSKGAALTDSMRCRSRGVTFAAFTGLIEPLRQLDHGYVELTVRVPTS